MTSLLGRERDSSEKTSDLRGIVVFNRGLESLPGWDRLRKLSPQPAAKADLRSPRHDGRLTTTVSPSSETDPPSAAIKRTGFKEIAAPTVADMLAALEAERAEHGVGEKNT